MKQNKILSLLLTILLVLSCLSINLIYADETPYVEMVLDKTTANLGDVITATIKVNKMPNLGSYQLNIKYDPTVLQAIDVETGEAFEEGTFPKGGTVLVNKAYGVKSAAANEVGSGIINFGSSYLYMSDYKSDGMPEETGIIGKIGFKVLKAQNTQIKFEDTDTMPGAKEGTFFFDWDGKTIVNYEVKQPASITVKSEPTNSYVKMELDKTEVAVGDVITATIEVNEMPNLGSYQLNIKYDPTVLQAIDVETGEAFEEGTFPKGGTVLVNKAYGVKSAAANEVGSGIINFGSSYLYMSDYKSDGVPEETGIIGKIGFKVLKAQNTQIKFEDTDTMPGAKEGTFFFDWDGKTIVNYEVKQPASITVKSEPTNSYVKMELDKTEVAVGDVITATIEVNEMPNLGSYQLNIKYDPTVLQAIDVETGEAFEEGTFPKGGTVLVNKAYGVKSAAANEVGSGIINFGSSYLYMSDYKSDGMPEETGIIGKIGFKVLKAQNTQIKFEDTDTMPGAKEGTFFFDWDGKTIVNYEVKQPASITVKSEPTNSYVKMELDKTEVVVGDVITATIEVNEMPNLGSYQLNIKYDPTVLQAIDVETGEAFEEGTFPKGGTVLVNKAYGVKSAAANEVGSGIINFGSSYLYMSDYKSDGMPEETGIIGKIGFKVLKAQNTQIKFEDTDTMPGAKEGTFFFDWDGKTIVNYEVKQPASITAAVVPSPTVIEPTPTPTESETTPTESEVTPTESEVTPTESEVTPTESEVTPTESEVTPTESEPTNESYVKIELDKTEVVVGDTIIATVLINKVTNHAGYQFNIKYDPTVLQAVEFDTGEAFLTRTMPTGETIINKSAYEPMTIASNNIREGIINFCSVYSLLDKYREAGQPEETGIAGKIGFKVLKAQDTEILFTDSERMPGAISGTVLIDWYGEVIKDYDVIQPGKIKVYAEPTPTESEATPTESEATPTESEATPTESEATPTESEATPTESEATPTESEATPTESEATPTESEATPTESEATPTESEVTPTESEVTPTESEVTPTESEPTNESYVKIELDKTEVVVGDTIIATVLINKVTNHAGYQFNIKYDPTVLQAVEFDTGEAFLTRTMPTGETIINKSAYEPMTIASNNIREGIINFCSVYSLLDKYREAGQPEETGIAGKIGFKVLKAQDTEILFTDSERMPGAISGTVLIDWYGEVIKDYDVIQPGKIKVYAEPTPTESEATPTESEATPTESEATPTESEVTPTESEVTPTESEVTPTESEVTPTESEVTPTESEVTPTESEVTPTESEVTPTESEATPTESEVTPTESEVTPTESEVTPTESEVTPTESEVTPTESEVTPTESEVTPTESEVTPTESEVTPTESEVTPTESEVTPTESEVTPTESEVTPTESEVTPTESEVTPTESEVTPTESEVTPTESEVTPTESEVTPTESEATPTESEVTPTESEVTPTESEVTPTESEVTPTESEVTPTESEVTPTESEVTPTESEVTPTESEVTPTESEVTPTESEVTPTESEVTPTESEVTPTESEVTPTESEVTPTESEVTPTESEATPTESEVTPTESEVTPTESEVTPTESEVTPTESEVTPTESEVTPTESEVTPTQSEVTPTESEVTPTESEVTPTESEVTPTESEVTPTESEVTPTESEVTPTESEVTPTESEVTPTESEVTPTESEATPTESEATPTESEATPTESEATPTPTKSSGGNNKGGGYVPPADTATPTPTATPTQATSTPEIEEPTPTIPAAVEGTHMSYLKGYPDGEFKPERNITRAEAAVIFAKLLGANENTDYQFTGSYTDLKDTHWAAWAIKFASIEGLFKGYPDGSFKPDQNITRAEFATVVLKFLIKVKGNEILVKLENLDISNPKFEDVKGHWAQESIEKLTALGYISGYPDGTFRPENMIKRSESVALINRALERGPLEGAPKIFPDVDEKYWAFKDIAEGALDHVYRIDSDELETFVRLVD